MIRAARLLVGLETPFAEEGSTVFATFSKLLPPRRLQILFLVSYGAGMIHVARLLVGLETRSHEGDPSAFAIFCKLLHPNDLSILFLVSAPAERSGDCAFP